MLKPYLSNPELTWFLSTSTMSGWWKYKRSKLDFNKKFCKNEGIGVGRVQSEGQAVAEWSMTENTIEISHGLNMQKDTQFICKPGEMLLKSKPVRNSFARRFIHNLKDALSSEFPAEHSMIRREQGIFSVQTTNTDADAVIRRVFGITSVSKVTETTYSSLTDIVRAGKQFFQDSVKGKRFAVRCHRTGSSVFSSMDVGRELGAALFPFSSGVDLTSPEIICRLDVTDRIVTFYSDTVPAFGGLPVGSQGRAVALMSGGIDSPVAAWYGLKRGLELHYLFCCLGGPLQLWGPQSTARHLAVNWSYGYQPKLYVADFNLLLQEFQKVDHRYRNILLKRYFIRAADALAKHINAHAILTGESLGQVSSQTLSNLNVINDVAQKIILRPLTGMDKTEIINVARKIGTLDISEQVPEFCNVAVKKPKTRSHLDDIEILESQIDASIADKVCGDWKEFDLRSMSVPAEPPNAVMQEKPPGAWLIWIKRPDMDFNPPSETDQIINMLELSSFFKTFNRSGIILFACPQGTVSRDATIMARDKGIDAYTLKKTLDKDVSDLIQ